MTTALGRVFTLHGVEPRVQPRRSIYRNISDEATLTAIWPLESHSSRSPMRWPVAATRSLWTMRRALPRTRRFARRFGHAVTLFVNPSQVDPPVPYSFLLLSALLDGLRGHRVMLEGESFPTRSFRQRDVLRALLKEKLRDTPTEAERTSLIRALASEWRVGMLEIPRFLETLEVADLQRLLDAGVEIQNHGWSHTCHIRLDPSESAREIARGRRMAFGATRNRGASFQFRTATRCRMRALASHAMCG